MTGPHPAAQVIVPDLLGLDWHLARTIGEEAGLRVTGPDPDGPPLAAVGWPGGVVIRQRPEPGAEVDRRSELTVWLGRPKDAGDREPRVPPPTREAFAAEPESEGSP